jgi:hypothetical protein
VALRPHAVRESVAITGAEVMPTGERDDAGFSLHYVMLEPGPSISRRHTVAFLFKYDDCVGRSSGRALRHAHIFELGLWFTVQQASGLNPTPETRKLGTLSDFASMALVTASGKRWLSR